ncbi:MAG: enolase C-terminal domain-like protein [Actinomycetes bacterium]
MGTGSDAVVEQLSAAAYRVPTDQPEADGTAQWSATTLVLVQARSGDVVGTGWTYGAAAVAELVEHLLADEVVGRSALAVPGCWHAMVDAARNAGRPGAVGYAISAVDVALWDLKARLLGLSLSDLWGAVHDEVPVYGSGGFTTYDDDRMDAQLRRWVHELSIPRVKIKVAEADGAHDERDVHRMLRAREVIGAEVELFVDANGGYTAKQAARVLHRAAGARVTWLEEPVSSDDLEGLALLRGTVEADVTAGEYGSDLVYFRRMCEAGAVDCLQIDATRAGGYTAWFRAAAVAGAHGLEVSAHCAPHLHAPVCASTPNLRHVEWFHDHVRIESELFEGALDPAGGAVQPSGEPGHGLQPRLGELERFMVARA